MGNEAHKEPTMEEILASIRKIISDDELTQTAPEAQVPEAAEDAESFESLDLTEAGDDLDKVVFGEDDDALEAQLDSFEAEADDLDEPPSFEEMLGAARAVVASPKSDKIDVVEDEAPEPQQAAPYELEPESEPVIHQPEAVSVEEDMTSSARYQETVLTDDQTADAAAGALGKLISKMDMGGSNTLDGLVRELLKPMLKEWLDANLPNIVEEKVEAEVQRIARMAR